MFIGVSSRWIDFQPQWSPKEATWSCYMSEIIVSVTLVPENKRESQNPCSKTTPLKRELFKEIFQIIWNKFGALF